MSCKKLTIYVLFPQWFQCLSLLCTPRVFDIRVKVFNLRRKSDLIKNILRELWLKIYNTFAIKCPILLETKYMTHTLQVNV